MLTSFTALSLAPSMLAVFSIITLVLTTNAQAVTTLVEDFAETYVPVDYQELVTRLLGPVAEPLGLSGALDFLMGAFLPVWAWVKWPVVLALLIVLIAVLYYFTPNVRQPKFRWISLGSIVAIIGIALATGALYLHFSFLGGYSAYGAVGGVMALLFTLWVFNIVLLLGVEIERARELQADIAAEENVQLPPRDTAKVKKQREVQEKLESDGRELRVFLRQLRRGELPQC